MFTIQHIFTAKKLAELVEEVVDDRNLIYFFNNFIYSSKEPFASMLLQR